MEANYTFIEERKRSDLEESMLINMGDDKDPGLRKVS